jgi:hypothetical protein
MAVAPVFDALCQILFNSYQVGIKTLDYTCIEEQPTTRGKEKIVASRFIHVKNYFI